MYLVYILGYMNILNCLFKEILHQILEVISSYIQVESATILISITLRPFFFLQFSVVFIGSLFPG